MPRPTLERVGGLLGLGAAQDVTEGDQADGAGWAPRHRWRCGPGWGPGSGRRGGQGVGDVVGQAGHPGHLHPRSQFDLVAGDGGAGDDPGQPGVDAVLDEGVLQVAGGLLQSALACFAPLRPAEREQVERRERVPGGMCARWRWRRRRAASAACGRQDGAPPPAVAAGLGADTGPVPGGAMRGAPRPPVAGGGGCPRRRHQPEPTTSTRALPTSRNVVRVMSRTPRAVRATRIVEGAPEADDPPQREGDQ